MQCIHDREIYTYDILKSFGSDSVAYDDDIVLYFNKSNKNSGFYHNVTLIQKPDINKALKLFNQDRILITLNSLWFDTVNDPQQRILRIRNNISGLFYNMRNDFYHQMGYVSLINFVLDQADRDSTFKTIRGIKKPTRKTKSKGKMMAKDVYLYKINQDGIGLQGSKTLGDINKTVSVTLDFDSVKSPYEIFKQLPKIKKIHKQIYIAVDAKITKLSTDQIIVVENQDLAVGPR